MMLPDSLPSFHMVIMAFSQANLDNFLLGHSNSYGLNSWRCSYTFFLSSFLLALFYLKVVWIFLLLYTAWGDLTKSFKRQINPYSTQPTALLKTHNVTTLTGQLCTPKKPPLSSMELTPIRFRTAVLVGTSTGLDF